MIDPWPTDEDMAVPCGDGMPSGCGHPLGQHAYGADDWHTRCEVPGCDCGWYR